MPASIIVVNMPADGESEPWLVCQLGFHTGCTPPAGVNSCILWGTPRNNKIPLVYQLPDTFPLDTLLCRSTVLRDLSAHGFAQARLRGDKPGSSFMIY